MENLRIGNDVARRLAPETECWPGMAEIAATMAQESGQPVIITCSAHRDDSPTMTASAVVLPW